MEPENIQNQVERMEPDRTGRSDKDGTARNTDKTRILVAIANHGTKNRHFLDRLLAEYRSMNRYDMDIVVLSNIPKDLGPDIEVKVGLPTADPWSLTFAYKTLFAERAEDYDLFLYTEDDTLITEGNIVAFEEETRVLPEGLIAGFLRYELDPDGRKFYSSMHSHYHWDPASVVRHGNSVFAYYSNEHAACFILTRSQLGSAIRSGGFMLPPAKRRYGMPETAATDPYTQCGMKKMVCISRFDDFCLHHMPNAYLGTLGLEAAQALLEISKLMSLADEGAEKPEGPLFEPFPLRDNDRWNKKYYEHRRDDVLNAIPSDVRRVLSVGCGCGTTEAELVRRGVEVTAIPLDPVVGVLAEAKGIEILPADFNLAARKLDGRRFDCVIMMDILQQLRDPVAILNLYGDFLHEGGMLLVSVPNWNHHGTVRQRMNKAGRTGLECRATFGREGVHKTTGSVVKGWLKRSGFRRIRHCGVPGERMEQLSKWTFGLANGLLCRNLLVLARR